VTRNVVLYKTGLTAANSNMIAVNTSKGVVVIDSLQYPALAKRIRGMIEKEFGKPVAALINSHGAMDHTWGNEIFQDVPIYGHRAVKMEMERFQAAAKAGALRLPGAGAADPNFRASYPGDPREVDEAAEITSRLMATVQQGAVPAVIPTVLFDDSYVLTVGDHTFKMAHNTPTYSQSDIIIAIPEEKTLIVGDIFNKPRLPWIAPITDVKAWQELFAGYIADGSGYEHFLGTHGDEMTAGEIREQLLYVRALGEQVKAYGAAGKTLNEAREDLALGRFPHLSRMNPYFYGAPTQLHARNIQTAWGLAGPSAAEARRAIAEGHREWGKARVAFDRATFEKMLAPDFYVQLRARRVERQEFINNISVAAGAKLVRFDATVLTVEATESGWAAVIHEKLEYDLGNGAKGYSLWITRDGWRKVGNEWRITFSEEVGKENWSGGAKPPFPEW